MSYTPLKKIAELQAEIATLRAELKARNEQIAYPEASEDQLRQSKAVMYRELEAVKGRCGELEACLEECADDLESWIADGYPSRSEYPDEMRRYKRDIELVDRARALMEKSSDG